ncbi:MAG: hypothetical protein KME49_16560 [Brasilonema octagenarum HA4186-MV1]|jgi:hypothetical protein|nr:hypothetical protein [Brasilonema octagenarum HA4186-MV1]
MFFSILFEKYYEQIASALLSDYKKSIGKYYFGSIQRTIESLSTCDFQPASLQIEKLLQNFQSHHRTNFKPFELPENSIKARIKGDLEPEWSRFFKSISVIIDNHEFYKAIESRFKRQYDGIVKATEVLARDIKLIVDVQKIYFEAENLGKAKDKLLQNLRFLSQESASNLFESYYSKIRSLQSDIENYSDQTLQELRQAKEVLSFQVEKLLYEEQNIQSKYEQFFLDYRLRIAKQIDPVCDQLRLFSFRSQKFRSEFLEALIGLEHSHPEDLVSTKELLDNQFESLLQELKQMLAVEQANEKSRAAIKHLGEHSKFSFFQEVAEEAQQSALSAIGSTVRDIAVFPVMVERIDKVEKDFRNQINTLLETERKYLKIRKDTLSSVSSNLKFSIGFLNLASERLDEIFIPNSSYRLLTAQLNSYDVEASKATLSQLTADGTLLSIGDLGNPKREPINVSTEIILSKLAEVLAQKSKELGVCDLVGFIPVMFDEQERIDVPSILFFCRKPQETRPELTGLLEVRQQGKLLYIRKLSCILPLPSQVLNELLETYKAAFRANSRNVTQLIADDFLANKLKVDFQGQMAQAMTQAKQKLKSGYLDDLKQEIINLAANNAIETNSFLKTTDNLIIEALDSLVHGEVDKPNIW